MAIVRTRIVGLDEALAAAVAQVRADLPVVLEAVARAAVEDIRPEWPVATGKSRDSLGVARNGSSVAVVCDVDYASYIYEKGRSGPSWVNRIVTHIRDNIDDLGRRAVARLGG